MFYLERLDDFSDGCGFCLGDVAGQAHVGDALCCLHGRIMHPQLGEPRCLVLLLLQGSEELVDTTLNHHTWFVVVAETSLVEAERAETETVVEGSDLLPECASVEVIIEQES